MKELFETDIHELEVFLNKAYKHLLEQATDLGNDIMAGRSEFGAIAITKMKLQSLEFFLDSVTLKLEEFYGLPCLKLGSIFNQPLYNQ